MSDHHIKRPRRDVLEDLKQQGRFLECFLLAWGIIEMRSSEQILRAHGLSSQSPKSKSLLALSVGKKLKCLKELDYLSNEEYQTVIEFKKSVMTYFTQVLFLSFTLTRLRRKRLWTWEYVLLMSCTTLRNAR